MGMTENPRVGFPRVRSRKIPSNLAVCHRFAWRSTGSKIPVFSKTEALRSPFISFSNTISP
ncbi:hypothetical protein CKA32_004343 [Geitlerinema sp. FC II]|nr:hypothetical protein CKA32_004343 [Geitlerinema sp. FC II]